MNRGQIKTDPSLGRDKVDAEGCCRICGSTSDLEMAHTIGKAQQDIETVGPRGGRQKFVPSDAVIPLCGPFPAGCHGLHHKGELDLLPYLYLEEEINAARACGGLYAALIKLMPSEFRMRERV